MRKTRFHAGVICALARKRLTYASNLRVETRPASLSISMTVQGAFAFSPSKRFGQANGNPFAVAHCTTTSCGGADLPVERAAASRT